MSTPCASMSLMRSSGVNFTFGELNCVRLPFEITVPRPSPASCRKPYHSRPASAARQSDWGTRWAWMSMVRMSDLPGLDVHQDGVDVLSGRSGHHCGVERDLPAVPWQHHRKLGVGLEVDDRPAVVVLP